MRTTLFVQVVLSILGGTTAISVLIWRKKVKKNFFLFFSWMLDTFCVFWSMNAARFVLLYDETPAYAENGYLFVVDMMLVLGIAGLLGFTGKQDTRRSAGLKSVVCVVLAAIYMFSLIVLMRKYSNMDAAIYWLLQPKSVVLLGAVILSGYLILNRFLNEDKVKKSYSMMTAVSILFVLTLFLYPTVETLLTNAGEFSFEMREVWYFLIVFAGMVFVVTVVFLGIIPARCCHILCTFLWAFCISAYLQGMFLNGKLFLMDGKKSEWSNQLKIANWIVWCVCAGGLTTVCFLAKRHAQKIMTYSSLMLCIMQAVGVLSLIPAYPTKSTQNNALYGNYLSMKGMEEVASDENVIVFVLDTYDVDFIEQVLDRQNDFLEPLKGFIYFPDNVSQFSRTFPSITYMLTEETYYYEIPMADYVNEAFSKCIFWDHLREGGYKYYLFEEHEDIIGKSVLETAENFVLKGIVSEREVSFLGCLEAGIRIGGYRLMPYAFKSCYTYTSKDINDMIVSSSILDTPMYEEDDAYLWEQLRANGLTVGNDKKAFRFIHMNGAHAPYTMDEYGRTDSQGTFKPEQMYEGCMRFVYDYLSQLQILGVYEQATIIITADHGENFVTEELTQETNPILFIKPGGVGGDAPMKTSDVMASQNDLLPTICAAIGMEYDDVWGLNLLDMDGRDKTRTRHHYYAVVENTLQTKTRKYDIVGNSRNFDNWIATDEYHEFGEYY